MRKKCSRENSTPVLSLSSLVKSFKKKTPGLADKVKSGIKNRPGYSQVLQKYDHVSSVINLKPDIKDIPGFSNEPIIQRKLVPYMGLKDWYQDDKTEKVYFLKSREGAGGKWILKLEGKHELYYYDPKDESVTFIEDQAILDKYLTEEDKEVLSESDHDEDDKVKADPPRPIPVGGMLIVGCGRSSEHNHSQPNVWTIDELPEVNPDLVKSFGLITAEDIPDATFGVVFFERFPVWLLANNKNYIENAKRILKPGGKVAIICGGDPGERDLVVNNLLEFGFQLTKNEPGSYIAVKQ